MGLIAVFYILNAQQYVLFFFFSSRRWHTRWNCDWSSDVCSSDLFLIKGFAFRQKLLRNGSRQIISIHIRTEFVDLQNGLLRSEERRVGKECRSRWSPYH